MIPKQNRTKKNRTTLRTHYQLASVRSLHIVAIELHTRQCMLYFCYNVQHTVVHTMNHIATKLLTRKVRHATLDLLLRTLP